MKVNQLLFITVCTALMLAVWQILICTLSLLFQWSFFAALVFVVGVPHGALDLYVQEKSDQISGKKSTLLLFLVKYCSTILLYVVTWYLFPTIAFVLFLVISCLHFGETDLRYLATKGKRKKAIGFIYGVGLLLILLLPHLTEVKIIVEQLLPNNWLLSYFLVFMQLHTFFIVISSILTLAIIVGLPVLQTKWKPIQSATWLLVVLLGCCGMLPLLPAFALYFVGWHSIISLHQIGRYIKSGNTKHQNFVLPLLKKGLPFSLIAMMGLAVAYFLFQHYSLSFKPLPLVLVFLSVITLPHLQVMNGLNNHLPLNK